MQKLAAAVIALAGTAQANYLSGEVRSQEWFTFGKFVAKMQNPGKMGTVQSFFTYTAQDWPHGWNEIDVEIVPSVAENPFSMNIIWKDGAQDHNYATGFHPSSDWVTYSVEWTPDSVSWFVNDKLVRKTEGTEDVHFLNMPTQLMMNFWTPMWSPWNDYFDDAAMPWYAKYDFVEVYDYDHSSKSFNLRWRDDFNTWDTKKWYASDNWGFDNNSSLFMSSQVYVEDGSLVLKMDYNDGHAREFPLHHEVHHEKPAPKTEHHEAKTEAHADTKAAHPVTTHHTVTTHAVPIHHETIVHHEPVVHEVVDTHKFEAPLVHHTLGGDVVYESTGYPHHDPAGYDIEVPHHPVAYGEGPHHGVHAYETITGYPEQTHEYTAYTAPAHGHLGDAYLHDTYPYSTDVVHHYPAPEHFYQ